MKQTAYNNRKELQRADFFAVAAKGNGETHFIITTRENFAATINDESCTSYFRAGRCGLHWKGMQATKCKVHGMIQRLRIAKKWDEFEVNEKTGTMSDAQEKAVCDALNKIHFLGQTWKVTARERRAGYKPDITGDLGTTIEVKGFNAYLYVD